MSKDSAEDLAGTLDWCADQRSIGGLHIDMVHRAAALLRQQTEELTRLEKIVAANVPTVLFEESKCDESYRTMRRFTFIAAKPQAYQVEMQHYPDAPYPIEDQARQACSMFAEQFGASMLPLVAQAVAKVGA